MEKKIFNPADWLNKNNTDKIPFVASPQNNAQMREMETVPVPGFLPGFVPGFVAHETEPMPGFVAHETESKPGSVSHEIEQVIQQLELSQTDITAAYSDWRNIGFAFADAFAENGRDLFHRVSRFHPGYSAADCNTQYDNCLKANGHGITLKTFFYLAKQAGITLKKPLPLGRGWERGAPTLPDPLFPQLPGFLKEAVKPATAKEERDILLLGAIGSISACFPQLYGIYDGKKVHPNLFLFITARASAGKGRLVHCKQLVAPIHKRMREQAKLLKQQYDMELAEYNESKGKESGAEKPARPPEKMLFIPANSSSTGVFQLLSENEGRGLIFETEGDTLSQIFKSDYGNYSDGFRKAFHHETISYYRRTDREYVDIESPSLSAILSGTPQQIASLIPNAENGLFSRFVFYYMDINLVWKDVFSFSSGNALDDYFKQLGERFYCLYEIFQCGREIQFCFTASQEQQFNRFFEQVQQNYLSLQGLDYMATVRRLGLVAFRIAMILSALRIMEDGELPESLICKDPDFQTTLQMIKVLVKHASKVFSELPEEKQMPKRKNQKERFLQNLPKEFNRRDYLSIAQKMNIADKTAEGYIGDFSKKGILHHEKKDHYINMMFQEIKEV